MVHTTHVHTSKVKKKKKKKNLRCGTLLVLARADSHVAGNCACSVVTSHNGFGGPQFLLRLQTMLYCHARAIAYDINLIQAELKLHLMSSATVNMGASIN
jgi:hypothetical protein